MQNSVRPELSRRGNGIFVFPKLELGNPANRGSILLRLMRFVPFGPSASLRGTFAQGKPHRSLHGYQRCQQSSTLALDPDNPFTPRFVSVIVLHLSLFWSVVEMGTACNV